MYVLFVAGVPECFSVVLEENCESCAHCTDRQTDDVSHSEREKEAKHQGRFSMDEDDAREGEAGKYAAALLNNQSRMHSYEMVFVICFL